MNLVSYRNYVPSYSSPSIQPTSSQCLLEWQDTKPQGDTGNQRTISVNKEFLITWLEKKAGNSRTPGTNQQANDPPADAKEGRVRERIASWMPCCEAVLEEENFPSQNTKGDCQRDKEQCMPNKSNVHTTRKEIRTFTQKQLPESL